MSYLPKQHIVLITFSTILAAFSLASIVNFTDPYKAGVITLSFFYISLFLVSLGIFTIIGLAIRQRLTPQLYIINLLLSFRQALLISILILISFILIAQKLLYWWVEGSLILFLLFVEIFLNLKV